MFEIEQKYADADFPALEAKLRLLAAVGPATQTESDHYFNAPDRDFARTGEAFRLRRVGGDNFLTFKGRRQPGAVRVRRELEFAIAPGDDGARQHSELLQMLGYRPVAVVGKRRASYELMRDGFRTHVCLDDVEGVGRYAEVEIVAPPDRAAEAAAALAALAADLGLSRVEPLSYLGLLLARRAAPSATPPAVVRTVEGVRSALREARRQGKTVGLVPTMGALHEGHAGLIRAARAANDFVAVSVFVNPTQFGPHEDLSRYPRPFDDDVALCASLGVDLVYHPTPEAMYPGGYRTYVEVTGLQDVLEGASRPGHFRGVATVVLKLLLQVGPDRAYFGQKDAQQVRVIERMVEDLDVPVEVVVCPTAREADGLALSSRNRYLDPTQRAGAVVLSKALRAAKALHAQGRRDAAALVAAMTQAVAAEPGAALDYAACVDAETLEPLEAVDRPALLALAVRFGTTRLIDNEPIPIADP